MEGEGRKGGKVINDCVFFFVPGVTLVILFSRVSL
jgi:hypothetical protein